MKKFLLAMAVLCMGTMALAGPNDGGTLVAHDASLLLSATNGSASICGQGTLLDACENADVQIDGAAGADPAIFKVYAAFRAGSAPRLMGLTWGVTYDDTNIVLPLFGKCGDFELNDDGWPGTGKGSTVTWNTVQQAYLVPVYYFAAYTYGAPGVLSLNGHPSQGGYFGDDTVPAILDPIAAFGAMGFDMPGVVHCPQTGPVYGACCDQAGGCTITEAAACGGVWHPEWVSCNPNPCPPPPPVFGACCDPNTGVCTFVVQTECPSGNSWTEGGVCDPNPCPPPVPTETRSWGQIKANYR